MAAPIVVSPTSRHTATVIWLHGLGDNGSGWSDVARQLNLPWIKFLLPNAPSRPVTINMGASMPAWADIKGLSPDAPEDEEGTMKTRQYIHDLIAEEVKNGIPADRIMVGGFSQGAAMACFAALTHEVRLGGCFVLSGYLAMRNKVPRLVTKEGVSTPFFQAHGVQDPVVPFMFGQLSSNVIQSLGVNMKFKQYNMDHSSCDQELKDLRDFIAASVPNQSLPPIPDDLHSLSAKELKQILKDHNIDSSDCFEKDDLIRKVQSCRK